MDLCMPRPGGLEAIRRIKTECPTRTVVLTAIDVADTRTHALKARAACFLPKPAGAAQVCGALRQLAIMPPPPHQHRRERVMHCDETRPRYEPPTSGTPEAGDRSS